MVSLAIKLLNAKLAALIVVKLVIYPLIAKIIIPKTNKKIVIIVERQDILLKNVNYKSKILKIMMINAIFVVCKK